MFLIIHLCHFSLDIDALRIVANGVNKLKTNDNATIVITHYQRLETKPRYFMHCSYMLGLKNHPQHEGMKNTMNDGFGFGGMFVIDIKTRDKANKLMEEMQKDNVGYLAVSLGFYKTLFCAPGSSTSSEISEAEQKDIGLSESLIRFSVGLDDDIERTYKIIRKCMEKLQII